MTNISTPDHHEYNFQYTQVPQQELIPATILEILNSHKEWDVVSVRGKIISLQQGRSVGSPRKRLQLVEAVLADGTGSIPVDLWESNIGQVEQGKVYLMDRVQVSIYI